MINSFPRAARCPVPKHGLEFGLRDPQVVGGETSRLAGHRGARPGPNVVARLVSGHAVFSRWSRDVWELGEYGIEFGLPGYSLDARVALSRATAGTRTNPTRCPP